MSSLLITGASGVIGGALARRLVKDPEWKNSHFVFQGRNAEKLEKLVGEFRASGTDCEVWVSDFSEDRALLEAKNILGSRNDWKALALIAGNNQDQSLSKLSEEKWDEVLRDNVRVHACMLREVFNKDRMLEGGAAILCGSIVGVRGNHGQTAYGAAKGLLEDLMKQKQRQAAARKWRLNLFLPPLVNSPLLENLGEKGRKRLFAGRLLQDPSPELSAAENAAFLLSKRSSFVHAQLWHGDSRISSLPWRK